MNETIKNDRVYKSDQPDRNITHIIRSVPKLLSQKMIAATLILSLILALSAAQPNRYPAPMTYAQPSYAAPSYDVHDVVTCKFCSFAFLTYNMIDHQLCCLL